MNSEVKTEDRVARHVIDCAMRVHTALGPGLLESVYETCLVHELGKAKLCASRQIALPVTYDGLKLDAGYRLDVLVENCVVVELKTVEQLLPIHTAQLLSLPEARWLQARTTVEFSCRALARRNQAGGEQFVKSLASLASLAVGTAVNDGTEN